MRIAQFLVPKHLAPVRPVPTTETIPRPCELIQFCVLEDAGHIRRLLHTWNDGGEGVGVLLVGLDGGGVLTALLGDKGDPLVPLRQYVCKQQAQLFATLKGQGVANH